MEVANLKYITIGVVGALAWSISYFYYFKSAEIHLNGHYSQRSNSFFRFFNYFLGLIAWGLITFALTGPREPVGFSKNKIEVNDVFFVVDVSRSMLATDFAPNRLEAAKNKILEFVELTPKDRIGIIMFSEKAFTLLPLSTDLKLIKRIIGEIKVGFLGSGTNIGDALGLAIGRAIQSLAKNKILILLTDGVSNVGFMTPLQAAAQAKEKGIKVYTIGIGGDLDAKIPLGRNGFQNIPGGSIDTKTLKEIAKITGGKDYLASDVEALSTVLSDIEKLERGEIDSSSKVIYKEVYLKFLIAGVFLLILVELFRKLIIKEGE